MKFDNPVCGDVIGAEGGQGIEMQPLNGQDQKTGEAAANDDATDTLDVVVIDGKKGPQ